jgi:predicted RecB family nuclease|tara:strand:- start:14 stop:1864 length:1851 start_codon:yes stop_codon:yes gene_type:complete
MARSHVTHNDDGVHVPHEWDTWVSAGKTRNYLSDDPLLDWLNLYGEKNGFRKDTDYDGYDENLDFLPLLFRLGRKFEDKVVEELKRRHGADNFVLLGDDYRHSWNERKANETFDLMKQGVPFIQQAVLWNPQNRTFGMPDLLVRSNWLNRITEEASIKEADELHPAPALDGDYHYRVVDIKFSTLRFNADNQYLLDSHGSQKAYKAQLAIYNRALGRLQEYNPPQAYLLGRKWLYQKRQKEVKGKHALERLAPVDFFNLEREFYGQAEKAVEWFRMVRDKGSEWHVYPEPSVPKLFPNAKNNNCYPWDRAKSEIVEQLKDVTQLWQVGVKERKQAHELGITTWDDTKLTPQKLGIRGEKRATLVEKIVEINLKSTPEIVLPRNIKNNLDEWQDKNQILEFFVDFETVNDLDDDFSSFPDPGGKELIFMVGCGYEHPEGKWNFAVFTANELSVSEETRIIEEWIDHMRTVTNEVKGEGQDIPHIFHWSPAEVAFIDSARRNRQEESGDAREEWADLPWFDFLKVMRAEPIVVKGAFGFGLKAIAKSLYKRGLIQTSWGDGPADGMGAMVGAWYCNRKVAGTGQSMRSVKYMQDIEAYNEVDCRVMWEVITYLRENHT